MEVILVYFIVALVFIWSDAGSIASDHKDDQGFEKSHSQTSHSQPTDAQGHKQLESVRGLEDESFHSPNPQRSQKM